MKEEEIAVTLSCRLLFQPHSYLTINTWVGVRWSCEIESWYFNRWS